MAALRWVIALVSTAIAAASVAQPSQPRAELILVNGRIVTVDASFSIAKRCHRRWPLHRRRAIERHLAACGPINDPFIDLAGKTVVPGLMDNHLHSAGGGPGVDLSRARTLADVARAVADRVAATDAGGIVLSNSDWHEAQLKEQRLPLRDDLDKVAPKHAVVLVRGGHEYILNSAALARWKIDERTPEPAGGRISRYPDGRLNGELVDTRQGARVAAASRETRTLDQRIADRVPTTAR